MRVCVTQTDIFSGALFIQVSLGWDLYLSTGILLLVTSAYTVAGAHTHTHTHHHIIFLTFLGREDILRWGHPNWGESLMLWPTVAGCINRWMSETQDSETDSHYVTI